MDHETDAIPLDGDHDMPIRVGFVGIGVMGEPMALNLVRAGVPLIVWSRRRDRNTRIEAAGARVAAEDVEVFRAAHTIIMMLVDWRAMDQVLKRGSAAFPELVRDRTIINMATVPPAYSEALEADLQAAGARYVEAPVSGQRPIAEAAGLVAMVAGTPAAIADALPLLAPMCRSIIPCGGVPRALAMKLGVNLISAAITTALAEGVHYAQRQGLDLSEFAAVLSSSSLASDFLGMKLPKLVAGDFAVQGALAVGRKDFDMMRETDSKTGAAIPLLDLCGALWDEAMQLGHGAEDVSAVLRAYEARAARLT